MRTAYQVTKSIRASRRRFSDAVKETAGCLDCGGFECLHFDHRPGEAKLFNIAQGGTSAWPVYVAEVMKCDVRCARCHARRHLRDEPRRMRKLKYAGTEKQFLQAVRDLARLLGWRTYHPLRSDGSEPGYPDLTLTRGGRVLFAELKTERGRVTEAQRQWLDALALCPGLEVFVWRPGDWDAIERTLRRSRD